MTELYKNAAVLCPNCETPLFASRLVNSDKVAANPVEGDYSICWHCSQPLVFRAKLIPCATPPDVIAAWDDDTRNEMDVLARDIKAGNDNKEIMPRFTPVDAWEEFAKLALADVNPETISLMQKSFYTGLLSVLPLMLTLPSKLTPDDCNKVYTEIFNSLNKELGVDLYFNSKLSPSEVYANDKKH